MRLLVISGLAVFAVWWGLERFRRRTFVVEPGLQKQVRLAHRQPFELYHNAFSLCSMKTRVCLAELKIPYRSHHIELVETGAYETIRPQFLAVNPAGTVPVLVHEGHPIYESHEQIRYAAAHAPPGSPSLIPEDPALRDEMERWVDRTATTRDTLNEGDQSVGNAVPPLVFPLFAAMIETIPYWKIAEGLLFHIDRRRPALFTALKVLGPDRLVRLPPVARLLARARRQVEQHLDALEEALGRHGGPWVLGESFTLADVGWMVTFERLRQCRILESFVSNRRRPTCDAYWARLQSRASYKQAILDHAHPTVERGMARLARAEEG